MYCFQLFWDAWDVEVNIHEMCCSQSSLFPVLFIDLSSSNSKRNSKRPINENHWKWTSSSCCGVYLPNFQVFMKKSPCAVGNSLSFFQSLPVKWHVPITLAKTFNFDCGNFRVRSESFHDFRAHTVKYSSFSLWCYLRGGNWGKLNACVLDAHCGLSIVNQKPELSLSELRNTKMKTRRFLGFMFLDAAVFGRFKLRSRKRLQNLLLTDRVTQKILKDVPQIYKF